MQLKIHAHVCWKCRHSLEYVNFILPSDHYVNTVRKPFEHSKRIKLPRGIKF